MVFDLTGDPTYWNGPTTMLEARYHTAVEDPVLRKAVYNGTGVPQKTTPKPFGSLGEITSEVGGAPGLLNIRVLPVPTNARDSAFSPTVTLRFQLSGELRIVKKTRKPFGECRMFH